MSEPGPNWAHLSAQADYEQVEASVRLLAMQAAAYYRQLRRYGMPRHVAAALVLQWQEMVLDRATEGTA